MDVRLAELVELLDKAAQTRLEVENAISSAGYVWRTDSRDRDLYLEFYSDLALALARTLALALDRALDRARDLALDLDRARDLARDLALDLDRARDLARDLARALDLARDLALALDRDLARDLARALDRDLDLARALDLARDLALDLARALDRASGLAQRLPPISDSAYIPELQAEGVSPHKEVDARDILANSIPAFTATPTPKPMYGNVSFPAETIVGRKYALHVQITHKKQDPLAPDLNKLFEESPVRVLITLAQYQDAFTIEGSNQQEARLWPDKDSEPLVFEIKVNLPGEHELFVDFFQSDDQGGTRYLGRRVVHTTALPEEQVRTAPIAFRIVPDLLRESEQPKTPNPSELSINPLWPPPDLLLRVERVADQHYQISLASAELGLTFAQTRARNIRLQLEAAPHTYMQDLFAQLDYRHSVATMAENVFWDRLNGLGATLYDRLFPDELKAIYWDNIHPNGKIKTIQILSDEAWIPWELIKPYRRTDDAIEEAPFLSERFQLSRWLAGCDPGSQRFNLHKLRALFGDLNLEAVGKERSALEALASQQHLTFAAVDPTTSAVFALLKEGGFHGLHFACHGEFDVANPDHSQLRLSHGEQLQPSDISGERTAFGKDHPLIFLNACETGRAEVALVGLGGWVPQFLKAGAAAFVGATWAASDESAHLFASCFYAALLAGKTLGAATQEARLAIKKVGDPTWLAYAVYGDPNLRILRSEL